MPRLPPAQLRHLCRQPCALCIVRCTSTAMCHMQDAFCDIFLCMLSVEPHACKHLYFHNGKAHAMHRLHSP